MRSSACRDSFIMRFLLPFLGLATGILAQPNTTYTNPALPGWHSDPSCIRLDDTFYCVTSTFIAFPGLPVYASKDLRNWKLISHVWNRESQLPNVSWGTSAQQQGMYAATIRENKGEIYVICEYLGSPTGNMGVLFKTKDPFSDAAWSDPVVFRPSFIDPDLFWDDDGTLYVATQSVVLQKLNMKTGELSQPPISLWNGTGGVWPEGPHIYKKDGYYYLMIAEGGTAENHSVTIARSRKLTGPYEAYAKNPLLTARRTQRYFQTVGHADLFTDENGNWWGMALATRSGPEYKIYPMGRETVLFPVTWRTGEWPILQPVEGRMSGWPMPKPTREIAGDGAFVTDPDSFDFKAGSPIPRHLIYWRVPRNGSFKTTDAGLEITPSRANLTGTGVGVVETNGQRGLSLIARRQTDTLFTFTVDLVSKPKLANEEAGVAVFLTQFNHIDLGVVRMPSSAGSTSELSFRFRAQASKVPITPPKPNVVAIPAAWQNATLRLQISTPNNVTYEFSAMRADDPTSAIKLGTASAQLVSAGEGTFVGSLVGTYATCNGAGSGEACPKSDPAVFQRWRYTGQGQQISATEIVKRT